MSQAALRQLEKPGAREARIVRNTDTCVRRALVPLIGMERVAQVTAQGCARVSSRRDRVRYTGRGVGRLS
jgi:hypothetical protein